MHLLTDIAEATVFMAVCDGSKERSNMSNVRKEVWSMKLAKLNAIKAPDLKALPPNPESFEQNEQRSHIDSNMEVSC